jgi:segregation and condensation protein B
VEEKDMTQPATEPATAEPERGTSAQEGFQEAAPEELAEDLPAGEAEARLKAIVEAIVYVTDEPLSAQQIAAALAEPLDKIKRVLDELVAEYARPERGLSVREVAGGYKMATKAEHHEAVRAFVKKLTPPLKLSLAALETLAVVAYKQPVTAPEIMDIRGVQGAGVLKTLLDHKLISEAGRKNVVGKPILYKTSKEFLVQFGLKDLSELPTLKEFEELGRMELVEEMPAAPAAAPSPEATVAEATVAEAAVAEAAGGDPQAQTSAAGAQTAAAGAEPDAESASAESQAEAAAGESSKHA